MVGQLQTREVEQQMRVGVPVTTEEQSKKEVVLKMAAGPVTRGEQRRKREVVPQTKEMEPGMTEG